LHSDTISLNILAGKVIALPQSKGTGNASITPARSINGDSHTFAHEPLLRSLKLVQSQLLVLKQMYVIPLQQVRKDWPVVDIKDAGHMNCIIKKQFRQEIAAWVRKQKKM
jgi:hypothetical protein